MSNRPDLIDVAQPSRGVRLSVFDDCRPPSAELASDCVHCGFCLQTCPTYLLWGREADSPRGRIYLMNLGLEGQATLNENYVEHFDRCLGCMACLTSCPSGVQYDKLIEATRAQITRNFRRPALDRIFRRLLFAIFPHPRRLRILAAPLWLYQQMGVDRWLDRRGIKARLPARYRAMLDLMPPVSLGRNLNPGIYRAKGKVRLRVGLLSGCVQSVFFDHVNAATVRVLNAEGCDVVIPASQGCCGALSVHAGEEPDGLRHARRTIDAFDAANVDVIAINSAGCGSAMKEYGHLLRDDPAYCRRAAALATKCRDLSEVLIALPPRAPRSPINLRVAYHDACHLQHAQGIISPPRELLRSIPGLSLIEIPEAGICCGSAGVYNLLQPQAASELGQRKAAHVLETRADALVSANPGCLLQINSALRKNAREIRTMHWIELLDASLMGA